MNLASLIVSIVGCLLSLIGILITLHLTKRTKRIEDDLSNKFNNKLSTSHFNENRIEYVNRLTSIRDEIIANPSSDLSFDCWTKLDELLKKINVDVKSNENAYFKEASELLIALSSDINDKNSQITDRNKNIVSNLNALIAILNSNLLIGGL